MSIQENLHDHVVLQEILDEITQDYVSDIDFQDDMSLRDDINCERCDESYENIFEWCKSCQINDFKEGFTDWTSENEKIDNFIQVMQLEINEYDDVVFEWIPYDQFGNIKEIGGDNYLVATWKNGLLMYDQETKKYKRNSNYEV